MKVGILAGGMGTRLAEETTRCPKPMVEIGGQPILWHIMKHFAHYGHGDFAVALGYMGNYIKKYMMDFASMQGNLMVNVGDGNIHRDAKKTEDWNVALIETGLKTGSGGRVKRMAPHLGDGTFMLTHGDGVSDVNIDDLLAFHRAHGRLATVTAVRPPARFGKLTLEDSRVAQFSEKPQIDAGWINGAYFVMEPGVFDYIEGDETMLERAPLERLSADGQLFAYKHESFWQCMDTLRDKKLLERMWETGEAPWKIWENH